MIGNKDVRNEMMHRLDEDDEITDLLGSDDVIAKANEASDVLSESDAEIILAVGASRSTSVRNNTREETTFNCRVIVAGTTGHVSSRGGTDTLEALKDRAAALLGEHRSGWQAEGISGDEEIAFNDDVDLHMGVLEGQWIAREVR